MIGVQAEESSTISGGAPSYVALFGAIKLQDLSTTARRLWTPVLVLTVASVPATIIARPDVLTNYESYPFLFVIPVTVFLALICIIHFSRKQEDRKAFACSCVYLGLMLVGAAVALYPRLVPSSDDPSRDITTARALAGPHTLHVGPLGWTFGICLALLYFVVVYRMFRGKVTLDSGGYGRLDCQLLEGRITRTSGITSVSHRSR